MNYQHTKLPEEEPAEHVLKNLTVRVLKRHEYDRAGDFFDNEHYLGDLRTGRHLLQVVEYQRALDGAAGLGGFCIQVKRPR